MSRSEGVLSSLDGKTALVTGGCGGIGSAIVTVFLEAGADVISTDVADCPAPSGATSIPCDVSNVSAIDSLVEEVAGCCDALDIFVHACGITRDAMMWKMDDAEWREVMTVNLDSAFFLLNRVTPLLRRASSASVVLVSSINGERGKLGQANYCASKAGLIALGKTAARELGRYGVRVNSIAPGFIDTPMTRSLPDEIRERAIEETALGRCGSPEDVASAALFLATDLSRHITGQVLRVDGGQLTG